MKKIIQRTKYLDQLKRLKDKQIIKVNTGIRRCGKSTLFNIFSEYLIETGVSKNQIIHINLESPDYHDITDYISLYNLVNEKLLEDQQNYIFIDEVQNVPDFQKAIDGLFMKDNCDVYITGSNAYLLSGELATFLSGRFIEIKMLPLSFKEFISYYERTDFMVLYQQYITNGSFPYILQLENKEDINAYLDGIYNSIILKYVIARYHLSDVGMLDSVVRFMFDNIGNLSSSTKISNTMTSNGRKISVPSVETYLKALVESFILYKVNRYDIKRKNHLTTGCKYYVSDIGLRFYLLGTKKVDFIAINDKGEEYYQVAYTAIDADGSVLERELFSLNAIKDHNPKFLITMDYTPPMSHNGIKQLNALDWLLQS